ncbi:hypothetical protein V8D89_009606 [Ganoderma adspersum]
MQRYSNPEVFLCPYYNLPGISNPKMHMAKEGRNKAVPPSLSFRGTPQGLTTQTPVRPSASAQNSSSSPSSSRDNSLSPEPSSPNSDPERKVDDYKRIFEELIDAE